MIRFKALSGDKVDVPIDENGDGVEARTNLAKTKRWWNVHWTERLFCWISRKDTSCWYCKAVTFTTLAICTRTLAGNLRLWRFTANASSLLAMTVNAESMKQEWDIKVYNFL